MTLLNQMIATGRLEEFVDEFVRIRNEEQEDKAEWDVWLHRIFDKSFAEFRKSLQGNNKTAAPTPEEIKSIAMDSRNILAGFAPYEGLVDRNGTVQTAGDDCG